MTRYSVGVDIGGTFTDIVCARSDGSFRLMKRATTRGDPAAAGPAADGGGAIAIVFLFSFLTPAHERRAREIVAAAPPNLATSLSCEVDRAFREYEPTAVTAFDAYLKPVVAGYLARMEADLAA